MSIYNIIADNYSQIFPQDNKRTEYISSLCKQVGCTILDIGCATGDLVIDLAKSGYSVTGIDLNENMISNAQNNIKDLNCDIHFHVMDMMNIEKLGSFDLILCFGNTLPHLKNIDEIKLFFQIVHSQLNNNGYFLFQILNYDKILNDGMVDFPVIENNVFRFTRNYSDIKEDSVTFTITFLDKSINLHYSDSEKLLPVRRDYLLSLLRETGFIDINIYSGYDKTGSDGREFASIYEVKK